MHYLKGYMSEMAPSKDDCTCQSCLPAALGQCGWLDTKSARMSGAVRLSSPSDNSARPGTVASLALPEGLRTLVRSLRRGLPVLCQVEAGKVFYGLLKAFTQLDFGLPAQHLLRKGQVRAPLLWVVARERHFHDLALGACQLDAELRKLTDCELIRVTNVDRAWVRGVVHHSDEAFDLVLHEAEGPRLGAIAIDRDVLTLQRLHDEVRHDAPIIRMHARPVGVEDAGAAGVAALTVILENKRLCHALALVVAGAHTDGVDVAPVGLWLRRDGGVAVALRCGSLEEPCTAALREPKRVVGAQEAGLDRLHRVELVVRRGGGARQVVDLIHLDFERLDDIVADDFKIGLPDEI
mmetsp:Transcript_157815/g.383210  ORF Transcript_157815/g.383210 Transcript_157815/m.383210 type:complete len:351 (+) Transcript_157815:24-1076(+)